MPPGYQDWLNETRVQLMLAYRGHQLLDVPVAVQVLIVADKKPRGDLDNLLGAVLDAGNGQVWKDDRQVHSCSCAWLKPSAEQPAGLVVVVEPVGGSNGQK